MRFNAKSWIVGLIFGAVVFAPFAQANAADPIWDQQSAYTLTIGQTVIVYALRASSCGGEAPSFAEVTRHLPKTTLGNYADGGPIQRSSRSCASAATGANRTVFVKARGVSFTATKQGTEVLRFDGDPVVVTVK